MNPFVNADIRRPALRYFGGKWMLAPWIIENMPPHQVYVEPFAGGASVLIRKPRSATEIYNDLDGEIVGIFRVIQLLKRTPYSRAEYLLAFEPSRDPVIRAQRAIIRAYMSIHHIALFDMSKSSGFASARGHESWTRYPRCLSAVCKRLQGVVIEQRDAFRVIDLNDSLETLFFVDPPYLPSTRCSGDARYRNELSDTDHVRLLERLNAIQGRAMISGYPSKLYDEMLDGWERLEKPHFARANGSRKAIEVLWISPQKKRQGLKK